MSSFDQVSRRAKKLEADGRIGEAIKLYEEFLQKFPKNSRARAARDELLRRNKSASMSAAQESYQTAKALFDRGDFATGIAIAERIVTEVPESAEAWNFLGAAYFRSQNLVEAERCLRKALEIDKKLIPAWTNIGTLFHAQNRLDQALVAFQNASFLEPENGGFYNSIGGILISMGRLEEAEQFCARAIKYAPNLPNSYSNLAIVFYHRSKLDLAKKAYEKALQLEPQNFAAFGEYFYIRAKLCDWSEVAIELPDTSPVGEPGNSMSQFSMLPYEDDPFAQRKRSEVRARELQVPSRFPAFQPPSVRPEKLKIGYFSADFHNHATMSLMMGVLGAHNKDRFEIHAYSYGGVKEGWRRAQFQEKVEKCWDVHGAADEEIVKHAREQGIDIAIDLKGYTDQGRTRLFAHRIAPVQISYLGYPGTLGADFIDYMIADRSVIPDQYRDAYLEKLIYMPHCYQPNDADRRFEPSHQSRKDLGLPERGFVFCAFNGCYKISPREFEIWMRLLDKVDGSVLWLLGGSEDAVSNLRKEAKLAGIDPGRLIFADLVPEEQHLARQAHADLFLDTFNVNAHTTASDALWAGLPILTLPGKQFAARVAASILKAANLPELIAKDEAEYEEIALDLALNPEKARALKVKVQEQLQTCPLFDTKSYTIALEAGFEAAYGHYLNGVAPEDIDLSSSV